MIISPASEPNLDSLVDLDAAGFPEQERWSRESWRAELGQEHGVVLVARDSDQTVLGVAAFRVLGPDAELFRITVAPAHQRRGIGGMLLRAGMTWADGAGAARILLEVAMSNTFAQRLYERYGFSPMTIRRDYYGPGAAAIVMVRELDRELDPDRDKGWT